MKKWFYLIFFLFIACKYNSNSDNKDNNCFYYSNMENNRYCFLLNGQYKTIMEFSQDCFIKYKSDDSIFHSIYNEIYYKKNIEYYNNNFDTIYLANDIPGLSHGKGIVYNLKTYNKKWEVGIYYPYEYKGTYSFSISEQEYNLFNSILYLFVENVNKQFYPSRDTIMAKQVGVSVLYLGLSKSGKNKDYFGALISAPSEFNLLNQLVSIIIKNNILIHKKSFNYIGLLDVRARFNSYVSEYKYTGSFIEDIDSVMNKIKVK